MERKGVPIVGGGCEDQADASDKDQGDGDSEEGSRLLNSQTADNRPLCGIVDCFDGCANLIWVEADIVVGTQEVSCGLVIVHNGRELWLTGLEGVRCSVCFNDVPKAGRKGDTIESILKDSGND